MQPNNAGQLDHDYLCVCPTNTNIKNTYEVDRVQVLPS